MQIVNTFLCVAGTVLTYALVRRLYLRYKHPLINIVAGSAAIIITVLLLCDIPYATYEPARQVMTLLLGPATVALALPLYRYRQLLLRTALPILTSVCAGAFASMLAAGALARWGGLPQDVVISIMPRGCPFPLRWKWPQCTAVYPRSPRPL